MATTIFNGSRLDSWSFDGSELDEAYMNGSLVFKRAIELVLPGGNALLNLGDYIKANAAGYRSITLVNNITRGPIVTGSLAGSGYDVTFINNGDIRGSSVERSAFRVQDKLTFINNGWLRGAGGDGTDGANGKDDTYVVDDYKKIAYSGKNCWTIALNNIVFVYVNGVYGGVSFGADAARAASFTGPITVNGQKVYRDAFAVNGAGGKAYSLKILTKKTVIRNGGAGGKGGEGAVIDNGSVRTLGTPGLPSSPAGGFSGGKGGDGGVWGQDGTAGVGGRTAQLAGYALIGKGYLNTGSKTGKVNGRIK